MLLNVKMPTIVGRINTACERVLKQEGTGVNFTQYHW